jgi:uncharacterized protein YggE
MKKVFFASLVSAFIFTGICLADNNKQYFTVEADAIVRVKPDKVVLNVGIDKRGKNLGETKRKCSDILKKAIEYCKKEGIQEKNIQTDYINIRPVYKEYDNYETQYFVEQNISIILENVSKYDEFLTALIDLGINQVNYIDFQVNDLKKYRNESRKLAIAAAKERAAFLAQEAGFKLGDIVNLTDYSRNWFPFGRYGGANMLSNVSQNMAQSGGTDGGNSDNPDTLAPGMVSVKSNIVLTYEIKNK